MLISANAFFLFTLAGVFLNWLVMLLMGVITNVEDMSNKEVLLAYAFITLKVVIYVLYLLMAYEVRKFRSLFFVLVMEVVVMILGDYAIYEIFWKKLLS